MTADNAMAPTGLDNGLEMPWAVGVVHYDVQTNCPHCGKRLALNQYPYNDDTTEYFMPEDDLGRALFGSTQEPAKWTRLNIECICCGCNKQFRLVTLEI